MKFTKEEISLCKQMAEKHRKEIEWGDWFLNEGGFAKVWPYRLNCKRIDVLPLWTISDCLEFLRGKKWRILDVYCNGKINSPDHYSLAILPWDGKCSDNKDVMQFDASTLLEACLKAVLAVLEDKK